MKKLIYITLFFISAIIFASEFESTLNSTKEIKYRGPKSYTYIERTDLRRYDNGKYTGLLSREVRSYMTVVEANKKDSNGFYDEYEGYFFVDEGTKRANVSVVSGIQDSVPVRFNLYKNGAMTVKNDNGMPTFRGFPACHEGQYKIGDKWQAKSVRCVDLLNKNVVTKIPFLVAYEYLRDEVLQGQEVLVISAKWATRYGARFYIDFGGDRDLTEASGSHNALIYLSKATGAAILVRDIVDEYFIYSDGNKIAFKGTINLFTKYPPLMQTDALYDSLKKIAGLDDNAIQILSASDDKVSDSGVGYSGISNSKTSDGDASDVTTNNSASTDIASNNTNFQNLQNKNLVAENSNKTYESENSTQTQTQNNTNKKIQTEDLQKLFNITNADSESFNNKVLNQNVPNAPVEVSKTDAGIKLSIPNLQFKADSSELLAGEKERLDKIAQVLLTTGDAMLLVEGHTAYVGNEKGEMQLSKERARTIANELIKRGVNAQKLIVQGKGSSKRIAEGTNPESMAKNRRVEITIFTN